MAHVEVKEFKVFGLNMWQQVLIALILGISVGYVFGPQAEGLRVFGVIFLKLIKMMVAPLIFFALLSGITSLSDSHNFKGIVIKGTVSYILTALMAVALGLALGELFHPGVGITLPHSDELAAVKVAEAPSMKHFLLDLVPPNLISAMANDLHIQIVIFAIFTGIVMNHTRKDTSSVKELCKEMTHIVFKMIEWVVRLAPLAVFGFMASMVGTTGADVIISLASLVGIFLCACLFQYLFFGLIIMVFGRMSPMPFYKKMIPTQLMAFSTSSSKATLTTAMRELQTKMGVSQSSSNFMMPLGASINMDGTAIYLGLCATFFAQIYGIDLSFNDYVMLMLTCTLGSIGAAGVPSGSIVFMGMVLSSVGIPIEGIAIILGVDRILDMVRTTINITGDSAITLVVDKTENSLDTETYYSK